MELLVALFLLHQSEVQTSEEKKKKDFGVMTGTYTEKEKEGFSVRKVKNPFRKLEGFLPAASEVFIEYYGFTFLGQHICQLLSHSDNDILSCKD